MKENATAVKKQNPWMNSMETQQKQAEEIMNAKNALKLVLKQIATLNGHVTYIIAVSTVYLLLTSIVWFFPKAPSVPAVELTNQAVNTTNGV